MTQRGIYLTNHDGVLLDLIRGVVRDEIAQDAKAREPEVAAEEEQECGGADPGDRDPSQMSGSWIDQQGRYSGPVEDHAVYDADFYRRKCEDMEGRMKEYADLAARYQAKYEDAAKALEAAHHEAATLREHIAVIYKSADRAYHTMNDRALGR